MAKIKLYQSLVKDRPSSLALLFIGCAVLLAFLGANIRPDDSLHANNQELALARLKPMSTAKFLVLPKDASCTQKAFISKLGFGGETCGPTFLLYDSLRIDKSEITRFFRGEQIGSNGLEEFSSLTRLSEAELEKIQLTKRFWLGTDSLGRDLLSRLMAGTIISLSVGAISVLISLLIGISLGALAGYYRGWVDSAIMWLVNVIWSIPTLLMVIAITMVMGKGFVQVFVAVGLTMWVEVARIVRGQFLSLRELAYVEAGRTMGFSSWRIIFKHLLPNAVGPVIVISAANFASAILIEAGLSFLGVGTQIPMPSWGGMIKEHYAYITTDQAYLAILPGLCITALVMSFMILGNRLRDLLDVRTTR